MRIITVSREFGSGGREIAKRLSDALGIAYYDSEIITEIAKRADLDENYVANSLEKGIQPTVQIHFACAFSHIAAPDPTVKLLAAQHNIINEIAEKGDCIIVGRAADVLLEKYEPFRIFVYADMESKVARCRKRAADGSKLTDKEIVKKIKQIDKGRASGYNMISSTDWGDKRGYDLCVNTTNASIKEITPLIAEYARQWFKNKEDGEK